MQNLTSSPYTSIHNNSNTHTKTKKKFDAERQKARTGYMQQLDALSRNIKTYVERRHEELRTAKQIAADELASRQKEHNDTLH